MTQEANPFPTQNRQLDDYWERRTGQCSFRDVNILAFSRSTTISKKASIPVGSENNLLDIYYSSSQNRHSSASSLLGRLTELAPSIAVNYSVKETEAEQVQLRLLRQDLQENGPRQSFKSFIALSCCWPPPTSKSGFSTSLMWKRLKARLESLLRGFRDNDQRHPFPVSPVTFKALLDESQSIDEGIWVDQLCVAQEDEIEKKITIAALDRIYKSARMVVISLEDIEVSRAEETKLQKYLAIFESRNTLHYWDDEMMEVGKTLRPLIMSAAPSQRRYVMKKMHQALLGRMAEIGPSHLQPYVESGNISQEQAQELHQLITEAESTEGAQHFSELVGMPTEYDIVLRPFVQKIWSSRWLTRAWCAQDALMSEHHIFLVKCQSRPTRVLRFTGSFLLHLEERFGRGPFSPDTYIKSDLNGFLIHLIQLRSKALGHGISDASAPTWIRSSRTILALDCGGNQTTRDQRARAQDALRDKICIVLNILNTGLCYNGPGITEDEFCHQMIVLGLAARDPTALLTTGRHLSLVHDKQSFSWMQAPNILELVALTAKLLDNAYIPQFPATNLTLDPGQGSAWISLDLVFFEHPVIDDFGDYTNSIFRFSNHRTFTLWFMVWCSKFGITLMSDDGPTAWRDFNPDPRNPEFMITMETLIGCLMNGISWMASIDVPYHQFPNLVSSLEIIEKAYEEQHVEQHEEQYEEQQEEQHAQDGIRLPKALNEVMSFLRALVKYGLPDPLLLKQWTPFFLSASVDDDVVSRVVLYGPRGRGNRVKIAVPVCLSPNDYKDFNRVWLLEPRGGTNEDGSCHWSLTGKVRMVGDVSRLCSDSSRWVTRESQRVFGIE